MWEGGERGEVRGMRVAEWGKTKAEVGDLSPCNIVYHPESDPAPPLYEDLGCMQPFSMQNHDCSPHTPMYHPMCEGPHFSYR